MATNHTAVLESIIKSFLVNLKNCSRKIPNNNKFLNSKLLENHTIDTNSKSIKNYILISRAARLEDEFLPSDINITVATEIQNVTITILTQPLQVLIFTNNNPFKFKLYY